MSIPKPASPAATKKFVKKNPTVKKAKDAKTKKLNYDVTIFGGEKIVVSGVNENDVMSKIKKRFGKDAKFRIKKQAYKPKEHLTHRPFANLNSAVYGKGIK